MEEQERRVGPSVHSISCPACETSGGWIKVIIYVFSWISLSTPTLRAAPMVSLLTFTMAGWRLWYPGRLHFPSQIKRNIYCRRAKEQYSSSCLLLRKNAPFTIDAFFLATAGITSHVSVNSLTYSLSSRASETFPVVRFNRNRARFWKGLILPGWIEGGSGVENHRLGLLSINQPTWVHFLLTYLAFNTLRLTLLTGFQYVTLYL